MAFPATPSSGSDEDASSSDEDSDRPSSPKRQRADLDPERERINDMMRRRVPLRLEDVDALNWYAAHMYARAMGIEADDADPERTGSGTGDAFRRACKSWFVGRETEAFVPKGDPRLIRRVVQWSLAEERVIRAAHAELGNKWAEIAKRLPGKTDGDVTNHWYSQLRKAERSGLPRGVLPPL